METYVYAGNLPFDASEEMLRSVFSAVGTVEEVRLARDPEKGLFRGFAFIKMASKAEAAEAVTKLNNTTIGSREGAFIDYASNWPDLWKEVFGTRQ